MKISTRSEYAAKALLYLAIQGATNSAGHPAQIPNIAQHCDIPLKYLEQILVVLRNHGLLGSRRGVAGGYYLLRAPEEITVGDVVRLMDGQAGIGSGLGVSQQNPIGEALRTLWEKVDAAIADTLDATTFADLKDQVIAAQAGNDPASFMFYI